MGREKKAGEVEKEREREEKGEGSGREERGSAATLEGGRTKVRRMSEAEEAPRGTGVRCHRRQDGHDGQDEHDVQDVQDGSLCAQWGQRKRSRRRTPAVSVGAFFALRLCRKKDRGSWMAERMSGFPGFQKAEITRTRRLIPDF